MINFFTKLLTPIFITLGLVSPVIETPAQIQIIQTPIVQEILSDGFDAIPEILDEKNLVIEELQNELNELKKTNKVVNPVVKKAAQVKTVQVPIKKVVVEMSDQELDKILNATIPTLNVIDPTYADKLLRFFTKVERSQEKLKDDTENLYEKREFDDLPELNQELATLRKKRSDIVHAQSLGLVYGTDRDEYRGTGVTESTAYSFISSQMNENSNFLFTFTTLESDILFEIGEIEKALNKKKSRLIANHNNEIKDLQTQWHINQEDWIY